ncbi:roadblock/LC7 domain-containing protein [Vulcanisaeta distributa]|uniref:Roadblock/LC7 family protein n=1 Tax=Vulcanisaeta distributa (strain DSM 14429 / JCM 11212 / NBRC 100878 / IC-017) TaxID=572478 RepID=E1QUU2_VULDI|nr:roadblock/LC7 domain-containing protein [Vulcanisaeta distributa]ADN49945.1 Roadblock/LC7 family protein [Vulcanisaeta distributa DSM 14429]
MEETNETLGKVVKEFLNSTDIISGVYIASLDGLLVAHASRIDVDPDRVAAMVASLSAVGDRVSKELLNEDSSHVIVQASTGYIIIKRFRDFVIGVLVHSGDNSTIGLTMLELERLISLIQKQLR